MQNKEINSTAVMMLPPPAVALNIAGIQLQYKNQGNNIELFWQKSKDITALELLESTDGVDFTSIKELSANEDKIQIKRNASYYKISGLFALEKVQSNIVVVSQDNKIVIAEASIKIVSEANQICKVYNTNGVCVLQHQITKGDNVISINDLPKGVYILVGINEVPYKFVH
jgi:hypothetical protein